MLGKSKLGHGSQVSLPEAGHKSNHTTEKQSTASQQVGGSYSATTYRDSSYSRHASGMVSS
jgi:hypothetical protein